MKAIQNFLQVRPESGDILLCHFDGSPLTRHGFSRVLTKAIEFVGLPASDFKSHSFRIGAATTAAMLGIPDDEIKVMGRWKSDTYLSYIRFPSE